MVQIVDDTNIWMTGKENIKILLDVNERKVKSILKDVLYVPHLKDVLYVHHQAIPLLCWRCFKPSYVFYDILKTLIF